MPENMLNVPNRIQPWLKGRAKSFGYAFQGLYVLITTQPNAKIHAVATLVVCTTGYFIRLERWEWVAALICLGMVWMGEALNTALEFLADEVSLEIRPRIGKAKDVAAAGVLIAALASVAVAIVILFGHLK